MRHLFRVENFDRWGSNWPLGAKMCFFDPKIWIFGAKSQFFCLVIAIFCWWSKWPLYPGLQLSHRNHPRKIFRFRARGHFFGAHPCFWLFLAIPTLEVQLPLILVQFQRNSGEPSGPSKKWPRRTTDLVRAGITEKYMFSKTLCALSPYLVKYFQI